MQKNAFSRVGAKIWNETPNSLKNITKKTLKLLQIYEPRTWLKCFFFQSFSLFKNKKKQDPFQSNSNGFPSTGFPFA